MSAIMSTTSDYIRAAFCAGYKYSGAVRIHEWLARRRGISFAAVLLFHRVTDAIPEDGITVSTDRFRRTCRMLQRSFHIRSLADVVAMIRSGRSVPARTVAITFDDCYRDNLPAARILAEHGLPATFFIPTAFVGTDRVFTWDRGLPPMANLSWNDVREMARLGFDIGSHTVTHADLGVTTTEEAQREVTESKRALEEQLQRPVRWIAYPFGQRTNLRADLVPLIREAGYEACFSAYGGFICAGQTEFVLPREAVPCFRSVLHLELHLTGCLHWMYALRRRLGLPPSRARGPRSMMEELFDVPVHSLHPSSAQFKL
jgi:peptidoglycan/xylan/chitin deacetylase (PgdA/CDA1 family)